MVQDLTITSILQNEGLYSKIKREHMVWKGNLVVTLSLEAPRAMSDSHMGRDDHHSLREEAADARDAEFPALPALALWSSPKQRRSCGCYVHACLLN